MLKSNIRTGVVGLTLALSISPAFAGSAVVVRGAPQVLTPVPHAIEEVRKALTDVTQERAQGAQVASFRYRANEIYQVNVKPGMFTTISIPKDEPIKQFAVSDPAAVDLSVNAEANVGMLRLLTSVTVVATVVTDKHVFYLNVSPSTGGWHQGVSWTFDDANGAGAGFGYRPGKGSQAAQAAENNVMPSFDNGLNGHPNFNYQMEGDAAIRPVSVWDNGRFTWIQLPDAAQSIPAVFYLGEDGAEVVNYTIQPGGKQILVNRLMDKFLLRLGNQKVTVTAK